MFGDTNKLNQKSKEEEIEQQKETGKKTKVS